MHTGPTAYKQADGVPSGRGGGGDVVPAPPTETPDNLKEKSATARAIQDGGNIGSASGGGSRGGGGDLAGVSNDGGATNNGTGTGGGEGADSAHGEVGGVGAGPGPRHGGRAKCHSLGWKGRTAGTSGHGGGAAVGLSGADGSMWTLEKLAESFKADRFRENWRGNDGGGRGGGAGGGRAVKAKPGANKSSRGSDAGGSAGVGAGTGASAGSSGRVEGLSLRTERERRAWQVNMMRERVVQLRRAVEEGRLKPLGKRLFQVRGSLSPSSVGLQR